MKHLTQFVIFLIFFCGYVTKAQNVIGNDTLKIRRAQNINLEMGGPGFFYSVNYDARFSQQRGGFGGRFGFGIWTPGTQKFYTFPFQLSYLLGKKRNFLELGAGVTFLVRHPPTNHLRFLSTTISSNVFATSTIGYRFQSLRNGINFRASLNPMYSDNAFLPNFGFGVGYTFR